MTLPRSVCWSFAGSLASYCEIVVCQPMRYGGQGQEKGWGGGFSISWFVGREVLPYIASFLCFSLCHGMLILSFVNIDVNRLSQYI